MKKSIKSYLISFLFLLIGELPVISQNFNELNDFVDNKKKGSIDKALNAISEAGKLTQEANEYYNEALSLQTNFELDEKTLQKKLAKAEQKAISLQIEADKLYASAYKSLYETCQNVLNRSTISYGENDNLKNTASELMNDAVIKREAAKNNKNIYEKAALLNDAAGLEAAAIDNFITAIKIQNGVTPSEPTQTYTEEPNTEPYSETGTVSPSEIPGNYKSANPVEQKSENLAIDQNVINKYREYMNDLSLPDPIIINRSGIQGVDDASVDHARNIIHDYHYGSDYIFSEQHAYTTEMQSAIEDSVNRLALSDQELDNGTYAETYQTTNNQRASDIESYEDARKAFDISATPQATDIIFTVQVAASRIPLTRTQLWAIFPGKHTVEVIRENGWYKYRITGFRLFSDANRVALESGVRDAWVLSYQQGKPVDLLQAREMTRVLETDVKRYGHKTLKNPVDYYVQVVASKVRLDDNQIRQFCGVEGLCREIIEEGWFKYQINAGTEYSKATEIKNQLTDNSFMVAYERGTKVTLSTAINRNK